MRLKDMVDRLYIDHAKQEASKLGLRVSDYRAKVEDVWVKTKTEPITDTEIIGLNYRGEANASFCFTYYLIKLTETFNN